MLNNKITSFFTFENHWILKNMARAKVYNLVIGQWQFLSVVFRFQKSHSAKMEVSFALPVGNPYRLEPSFWTGAPNCAW